MENIELYIFLKNTLKTWIEEAPTSEPELLGRYWQDALFFFAKKIIHPSVAQWDKLYDLAVGTLWFINKRIEENENA